MRKLIGWLSGVVGVVALAGVVVFVFRAEWGLARAEGLTAFGMWRHARPELQRYLWLHPTADRARLLLAECFSRDETLATEPSALQALAQLAKIPDTSPLGSRARTQEARLFFLVLQQPTRAEAACRRAMELNPLDIDSVSFLWRIMQMTGRGTQSAPTFWMAYDLAPELYRDQMLRDWYMSQFFPTTANETVDRAMGFVAPEEEASWATEVRRYERYRETEPLAPLGHAGLARWHQMSGRPEEARKVLAEASAANGEALKERFFLGTFIEVLIDLGEFELAAKYFEQWPQPFDGHDYWKWRAIVFDEIKRDFAEASRAYERALQLWPGQADWRLRTRWANCLVRSGDPSRAAEERDRAGRTEKLMRDEVQQRLYDTIVNHLDDPDRLEEVADFYRQLDCARETVGWQQAAERRRAIQLPVTGDVPGAKAASPEKPEPPAEPESKRATPPAKSEPAAKPEEKKLSGEPAEDPRSADSAGSETRAEQVTEPESKTATPSPESEPAAKDKG